MRFDMTGIDAKLFGHWSCCSHLLEDSLPDTALRPPVVVVIDGRDGPYSEAAIVAPAASGPKDMQDATDHPTVVYSRLTRLAARKIVARSRPRRRPTTTTNTSLVASLVSQTQ